MWQALPQQVRDVVEQHIGAVSAATAVAEGNNSTLAAAVTTVQGHRLFIKGVRGRSKRMRWLRNEAAHGHLARDLAPRLRFTAEIPGGTDDDAWLVIGHDYVPGRRADLSPDSPDLPLVATTLHTLSRCPAPDVPPMRTRWSPTGWWQRVFDARPELVDEWDISEMTERCRPVAEMVSGDRLVHTDLHGDQFIIGDHGVSVIDWGLPAAGAPWIDTAFMILRLIEAGHDTTAAEAWARAQPTFTDVDDHMLTAFAIYVAGYWSVLEAEVGSLGSDHRGCLARNYARSRLLRP